MAKNMADILDKNTMRWIQWFTRQSRIPCEYCIPFHAEKLGRRPNCLKCGLPTAFLLDRYFKEDDNEEITKN